MAITANSLETSYDSVNRVTDYTTGSISPGSNRLVLAAIINRHNSGTEDPATPTLSGNGLTWVQIGSAVLFGDLNGGHYEHRLTLFRAMGSSPSAGALTIAFGSQQQWEVAWAIVEFDGVDTSGTNGSGAIVQSESNKDDSAVSSLIVTLPSFADAINNAAYGVFGQDGPGSINFTEGSGFTMLGQADTDEELGIGVEWRVGEDTSVDMSSSISNQMAGIAVEIKASVDFIPQLTPRPNPLLRM